MTTYIGYLQRYHHIDHCHGVFLVGHVERLARSLLPREVGARRNRGAFHQTVAHFPRYLNRRVVSAVQPVVSLDGRWRSQVAPNFLILEMFCIYKVTLHNSKSQTFFWKKKVYRS